jgi:hypothetical protein
MPDINNLRGGRIHFGSRLQRVQSMVSWPWQWECVAEEAILPLKNRKQRGERCNKQEEDRQDIAPKYMPVVT